jgi:hypothetical protein
MELTSVVKDIALAGLSRIGSLVFRKFTRRGRIESAWRQGRASNQAVERALVDFEVMLAQQKGGLGEDFVKFIQALECSGLVFKIVEDSLLGEIREETRSLFYELHKKYFPNDQIEREEFLEKLFISLQVSLAELSVGDPALMLMLRTNFSRLRESLASIDSQLDNNQTHLRSYSVDEIDACLEKIAKAVLSEHKINWVETHRGRKQVNLDKIYIPSRVKILKDNASARELIEATLATARVHEAVRKNSSFEGDDSVIKYVDLQKHFRRIIVLGDPGGGKSTLLQSLCLFFSNQYMLAARYPARRGAELESQNIKIPLRVTLRTFEVFRSSNAQAGLLDFLVSELTNATNQDSSLVKASLLHALRFGFVVLAFDGLDEILAISRRRDYVEFVRAFCDQFPLCPAIVTSRIVGYEDAPLPDDFERVVLERLDRAEVGSYVTKFLQYVCAREKEEAEKLSARFIEQTNENADDLRSNPLMLGLMTFLFNAKGDVPGNRPEIYRECALLMFEKWDQNRSIHADIPRGFNLLDLFGNISSLVFGKPQLEEGVNSDWLENACRQYFSRVYEERAKAHDAAKRIVKFLAGRSWVLSEVGPDQYKYTHRTFLEYFFAQQLSEDHESVASLMAKLLPKIRKREWSVIVHLALQIKTYRSTRRTADAVAEILSALRVKGQPIAELQAICNFASTAMTYMIPSESDARSIVENIVESTPEGGTAEDYLSAIKDWRIISNVNPERREYVRAVLSQALVSQFSNPERDKFRIIVGLAAAIPTHDFVDSLFSNGRHYLPSDVSQSIRTGVKQQLLILSARDPSLAFLYYSWYPEEIDEFENFLSNHGPRFLSLDIGVWSIPPIAIPYVPLLKMFLDASGLIKRKKSEFIRSAHAKALRVLGRTVKNLREEDLCDHAPHLTPFLRSDFLRRALVRCADDRDLFRGVLIATTMMTLKTARVYGESGKKDSKVVARERLAHTIEIFHDPAIVELVETQRKSRDNSLVDGLGFWFEAAAELRSVVDGK